MDRIVSGFILQILCILSFLFRVPDITFAEAEPARRRDFLLGEKLNAFLALHMEVAEEGVIPAVERKPRH